MRLHELVEKSFFWDEIRAYEVVELARWNGQPVCPHCGSSRKSWRLTPDQKKRIRPGVFECADCRRQYTVRYNSNFHVFNRTPLQYLLQAIVLMSTHEISGYRLEKVIGITNEAALLLKKWHTSIAGRTDLAVNRVEASPHDPEEAVAGFVGDFRIAELKFSKQYVRFRDYSIAELPDVKIDLLELISRYAEPL